MLALKLKTIMRSKCVVGTDGNAVAVTGQVKAVYDETNKIIHNADAALAAYERGDTVPMIHELVSTGISGFSLTMSFQGLKDIYNKIKEKGLWSMLKACFAAGTPVRT